MKSQIVDTTTKYLGEKTLQEFADALGIHASRQMVWHWKEGNQEPSPMTLFSILASPTAEGWAKAWAGECLAILQQDLTNKTRRLVAVRNLDGDMLVDPDFK